MNAESTIIFFKNAIITLFLQRLVLIYPLPEVIVENFGTAKMPMLKEYKNSVNEKAGLLNSTL